MFWRARRGAFARVRQRDVRGMVGPPPGRGRQADAGAEFDHAEDGDSVGGCPQEGAERNRGVPELRADAGLLVGGAEVELQRGVAEVEGDVLARLQRITWPGRADLRERISRTASSSAASTSSCGAGLAHGLFLR